MIRLRSARNCGGASAVESALTAPLFLMLIFGIIESGLVMWTHASLQHGVELAARCASIDKVTCPDSNSTTAYAAKNMYGLNPSPSVINVDTPACGNRVRATYNYNSLVGYLGMPPLTLSAASCFPRSGSRT